MNKPFLCYKPQSLSINLLLTGQTLKVLKHRRDFPGGPVVKTPPSSPWGMGLIPGWETKILQAWDKAYPPIPWQKIVSLWDLSLDFLWSFYFLFKVILSDKKIEKI